MRRPFFGLGWLLILLLLALCIWNTLVLRQQLTESAALLQQAAQAETLQAASDLVREASALWERRAGYYGTVLRHDETDTIATGFAALLAYAAAGEETDFRGRCAELAAQLEHIAKMEMPLPGNIL